MEVVHNKVSKFNNPRYIMQRERYVDEARLWNLSLLCSGRNSTTKKFEQCRSFTGPMLPCTDCNTMVWYDEMPKSRRSSLASILIAIMVKLDWILYLHLHLYLIHYLII